MGGAAALLLAAACAPRGAASTAGRHESPPQPVTRRVPVAACNAVPGLVAQRQRAPRPQSGSRGRDARAQGGTAHAQHSTHSMGRAPCAARDGPPRPPPGRGSVRWWGAPAARRRRRARRISRGGAAGAHGVKRASASPVRRRRCRRTAATNAVPARRGTTLTGLALPWGLGSRARSRFQGRAFGGNSKRAGRRGAPCRARRPISPPGLYARHSCKHAHPRTYPRTLPSTLPSAPHRPPGPPPRQDEQGHRLRGHCGPACRR